jgi:hypothetical protein
MVVICLATELIKRHDVKKSTRGIIFHVWILLSVATHRREGFCILEKLPAFCSDPSTTVDTLPETPATHQQLLKPCWKSQRPFNVC